jgi:hypothetical protein
LATVLSNHFFLANFSRYLRFEQVTLADALILTSGPFANYRLPIVLISCIGMGLFCEHDLSAYRLIRHRDFGAAWFVRLWKTAAFTLAESVWIIASSVGCALAWTDGWVDFENPRGVFAYASNGATMPSPHILLIVLDSFLFCFVMLLLANTLWAALDTIFRKSWLSGLSVFVLTALDVMIPAAYVEGTFTLSHFASINFPTWLPGHHQNLWLPLALAAAIAVAGLFRMRRWEDLSGK